jgi:YggT family protein
MGKHRRALRAAAVTNSSGIASVLLDLVLAVDWVLAVYVWLAFAAMLLVWLKGFKVVSDDTHGVAFISKYLGFLVEPVLRPIRAVIPPLGGVDGSPFLLLLIVMWVRYLMALYLIPKLA